MMELDEIVVKESPGLCRCCLSEGCYKDLGTEYSWMNDTEIYADMLLECFDISISQHNEGPNGPNRLICEVCITRLRDACNFKKQVVESEKKFVDMIGRGEFRPKVVIYQQAPMKTEKVVQETMGDDIEVEYLDEDIDFEDDLPLSETITHAPSVSDDVTVSSLKLKTKRGRPKKTSTVKTEKKAKTAKLEDKPRTSKAVTKGKKKRDPDEYDYVMNKKYILPDEDLDEIPEAVKQSGSMKRLEIMRRNVVQVLLKSTVMPFRWLKSSYRCFYCYDVFTEPGDLKIHNIIHIDDEEKYEVMNKYWDPIVFVDVSNLSCKLCPTIFNDIYELIDHLTLEHDVEFNKDIGICFNAFKLNSISVDCVECESSFRTFGHLLVHTNKEHRNVSSDILCEICGHSFKTNRLLKVHITKTHGDKPFKCPKCDVVIDKPYHLRTHMQRYHGKTYKCLICTEEFETYYRRLQHMITVHKNRETVTCPECPRTFVFRNTMKTHVREKHLQEKNVACPVCGWQAFDSNRLRTHMKKHSNEMNFKCTACDIAFKNMISLKRHVQNIHEKVAGVDEFNQTNKQTIIYYKKLKINT